MCAALICPLIRGRAYEQRFGESIEIQYGNDLCVQENCAWWTESHTVDGTSVSACAVPLIAQQKPVVI